MCEKQPKNHVGPGPARKPVVVVAVALLIGSMARPC
jgi:hypothetical protein